MKNLLLFLSLSLPTGHVFSQFQGPNNPTNITTQAIYCSPDCGTTWLTPGNAMTSDGNYATTYLENYPFTSSDTCYFSEYLNATGFGFSIPGNATINGILVEVEGATGVSSVATDSGAFLTKDGINHAGINNGGNSWGNIISYMPYGGITDLWGTAWTPAEINAAAFGFRLRLHNPSASLMPAMIVVDHVRATIYYSIPSGSFSQTSSPTNLSVYYSSGTFWLNAPEPVTVSVFNLTGEKIYSEIRMTGNKQKIETPSLPAGIYFVELRSKNARKVEKVIVKD